VPFPHTLA
jgi:hypothetical protein